MYLPTSTFPGICIHTWANPISISLLPSLLILVGHFFNSLPLMYSRANCLHKPDNFHNIPAAIKCNLTARGQLHFHLVASMMNTHSCKASRHVNLVAVSDSNYLSLSNGHVAFRRNLL